MSPGAFTNGAMSPSKARVPRSQPAALALARLGAQLGGRVHEERTRRRITLRELGERSGLSAAAIHAIEAGRPATLDSYARLSVALGLRPEFDLVDPRGPRVRPSLEVDLVHGAMAEAQSAHLAALGYAVAVDEPYQHYQFAGRADVLAWNVSGPHLLHIENRTRFPDLQAVAGSYNAKRAYLPGAVAHRLGIRRWASVTHVMAAVWSAEVLHAVRLRPATFRALCPDPAHRFSAWWAGVAPDPGTASSFVIFDPLPGIRSSRRRFVGLDEAMRVEPRYRGYADAASRLQG